MTFLDVFRFSWKVLTQRKARTGLTLLGVAVGAFVLMASLSIGLGIQEVLTKEYRRNDQLRRITIWGGQLMDPDVPPSELEIKGEMDEAKKERLSKVLRKHLSWKYGKPKIPLTLERLHELEQMEHVASVFPDLYGAGQAQLQNHSAFAETTGIPPGESSFSKRIVAGSFLLEFEGKQAVVSEFLLYELGIFSNQDIEAILGKPLVLEFRSHQQSPLAFINMLIPGTEKLNMEENRVLEKVIRELPQSLDKLDLKPNEREILKSLLQRHPDPGRFAQEFLIREEFTIVGVIRGSTEEELEHSRMIMHVNTEVDVVLPIGTAEKIFAQMPYYKSDGFNGATITVDHEDHVRSIVNALKDLGFQPFSLVEVLDHIKHNARLVSLFTAIVAFLALIVACLGITNTLLMTVLERTHEIGIMKAVGAKERHISLIFLVEGALIGVLGGACGLALSWIASLPGNAIAQEMIVKETQTPLQHTLFVFPWGLMAGIMAIAILVTTLAALYPARRAARINPISAIRYE